MPDRIEKQDGAGNWPLLILRLVLNGISFMRMMILLYTPVEKMTAGKAAARAQLLLQQHLPCCYSRFIVLDVVTSPVARLLGSGLGSL